MATEVSVLDKDGDVTYYSNYADATTDIINSEIEHPLVQIWADLDEQIILLDGVDIWIAPGVTISNSSGDTITDNNVAVKCNISGYGKLTQTSTSFYAVCNFTNSNSKVSVKCDIIENESAGQACVSSSAKKFHLECNLVYGKSHGGVYLNNNNSDDLNINAEKIVTGEITELSSGTTAIISRGNGFMHINEILCRNLGHCISHREGEITANIKKLTTKMNIANAIAAVHLDQGTGTQKLILYFDEILNFNGSFNSGIGIYLHEGKGIFIGRRVYSENEEGVDISGDNTKGYIKINEIISLNKAAIRSFSNNEQLIIDSDYIVGFGFTGSVYIQDDANLLLKNAKIINTDDTSDSKCIVLEKPDTLLPNLTLNNVKAVTGNTSIGTIIFQAGFTGISIKNYGFFANKSLDTGISLVIGDSSNFFFIVSTDLT
ncbi:MAG: hypothetical protein IPM96_01540 [Ignavibacteria bacterium]|nr:hypothetical protein [Ignavibacteria bacterium]